ncbi:MAG: hypothetical protein MUC60_07100 [Oscillatoria sp. Prado101]|jgi:hypothetical protein|nr:hypothetical protein [Oscillatoria sp. Prado101]
MLEKFIKENPMPSAVFLKLRVRKKRYKIAQQAVMSGSTQTRFSGKWLGENEYLSHR